MVLTDLQRAILSTIAGNRSETSYIAGGSALNRDWPRISDDMDIFHDTDEEIGEVAGADIAALRAAGFRVTMDIEIYGLVEAAISRAGQSTVIQWMSETRQRFFPLVRDDEWGARLHRADLAVNKVLAASTRTKPRDFVDLVMIAERMCPLGPLYLAAAGKPPHLSPQRMIEETQRRGMSVPNDAYETVRGLPADWTASMVREKLSAVLADAERYVLGAPVEAVGFLAVDARGAPVELESTVAGSVTLRRATAEPEVIAAFPDLPLDWKPAP